MGGYEPDEQLQRYAGILLTLQPNLARRILRRLFAPFSKQAKTDRERHDIQGGLLSLWAHGLLVGGPRANGELRLGGPGYNARASTHRVTSNWFRDNRRGIFLFLR